MAMLQKVPHRPFFDLEIVYYMGTDEFGKEGEFLIDDYVAKRLGISENDLFQHAVNNLKHVIPVTLEPIQDVILKSFEMPCIEDITEGEQCLLCDLMGSNPHNDIWVFSNEHKRYGASAVLSLERLQPLAQYLSSDLYLLPSSVHEMLVAPAECFCIRDLKTLLSEVTHLEVTSENEYLSESIYRYDRSSGTLRKVA